MGGVSTKTALFDPTHLTDAHWEHAHTMPIQVRYADLDTLGHVNNAAYLEYIELARVVMNEHLQLHEIMPTTPIARMEIDYKREVKLGDEVQVQTLLVHIGNTSFTTYSRIVSNGRPATFVYAVLVNTNPKMQPTPLPDVARERLEPYLQKSS